MSGVFERPRRRQIAARDDLRIHAEKAHHHRLSGGARLGEDPFGDLRGRRFGDEDDDFGRLVGGKRFDALQHGDAADLAAEIVAAGADRLADAGSSPIGQTSDLLQAGA